jgi:hypothetical protein
LAAVVPRVPPTVLNPAAHKLNSTSNPFQFISWRMCTMETKLRPGTVPLRQLEGRRVDLELADRPSTRSRTKRYD